MWCSTCQQDVPGLGSPSSGGELRCGKCGGNIAGGEHRPATATAGANSGVSISKPATAGENAALEKLLRCPQLPEDDWTLEAEVRGMQRLLSSLKSRRPGSAECANDSAELHLPQMAVPNWHAMSHAEHAAGEEFEPSWHGRHTVPQDEIDQAIQQPRTNAAAWTILSLSLAVFACGAVLLAWSLIGQRDDLWSVGLPLALIGQAGMILGLVLQVEGLLRRRSVESHPPARRRLPKAPAFSASERGGQ
jgi:hypothetical protein